MYARLVCRAAAPLRSARHYATSSSPPLPPSSSPKSSFGRERTALALLGGGIGATVIGYLSYPFLFGARAADSTTTATTPNAAVAATDAASAPPAAAFFTGGDQGFVPLRLADSSIVNHNTKLLRFHLPADSMVSGLNVASALLTKFQSADMEKPAIRPYTPVSDEDAHGYLDLLVKRYPGGLMSTHMHDLKPGQSLDFKGPIPKYAWAPNKHEHIALLAGGTGITPMYQLTRAVLSNPDDRTRITLVFANLTEDDVLLRDQLAHLENTYPQRFRAFYVVDNPVSASFSGFRGRITPDLLKTVLPEPATNADFKIFVCGPPGLMQALSGPKKSPKDQGELFGMLKDLGYNKDQVYKF